MSFPKRFEVKKLDNGFTVYAVDDITMDTYDLVFIHFDEVHNFFLKHFQKEHKREIDMETKS